MVSGTNRNGAHHGVSPNVRFWICSVQYGPRIRSPWRADADFGEGEMRSYRIDRRVFLALVYLAGGSAVGAPDAGAQDAPRPHIVHIVSDDQGWRDAGFHGSPEIRTPNLDRLAATGARLEQVYVTPMCTPPPAAGPTRRHPFPPRAPAL